MKEKPKDTETETDKDTETETEEEKEEEEDIDKETISEDIASGPKFSKPPKKDDKGHGGFLLLIKALVIFAILGAMGYGGGLAYNEIIKGIEAARFVEELSAQTRELAANQGRLLKSFANIEAGMDRLAGSQEEMSGIRESIRGIEQKLEAANLSLKNIRKEIASGGGSKGLNPEGAVFIPPQANPAMESPAPTPDTEKDTPDALEDTTPPQKGEQAFEGFMKSFLTVIGKGISWLFEKFMWDVSEIMKFLQ